MIEVVDTVCIAGDLTEVFRHVWDAERWPRITAHVRRVEMLESTDRYQRLRMQVESGGRNHWVESERRAVPPQRIVYTQTRPPAILRAHVGEWRFVRVGTDVEVTLVHRAELDEGPALAVLGAASVAEAERTVGERLRQGGALTMAAVKRLVEGGNGRQP